MSDGHAASELAPGTCLRPPRSGAGLRAVEDRCELRRAVHTWRAKDEAGLSIHPPRTACL